MYVYTKTPISGTPKGDLRKKLRDPVRGASAWIREKEQTRHNRLERVCGLRGGCIVPGLLDSGCWEGVGGAVFPAGT
jgi:hypothetical protein